MINIVLKAKRTSLSIQYNTYYKLIILLEIIEYCGKNKEASLSLINLIFWSLRDKDNLETLLKAKNKGEKSLMCIMPEFGLHDIITLGLVEGCINKKIINKELRISLTKRACEIIDSMTFHYSYNYERRANLQRIGEVSQDIIKQIVKK